MLPPARSKLLRAPTLSALGVVVTLTALASPRFPDGTWTATSGKTGTFAVVKE